MPNLNRIVLMGHLGKDPQVRQTQSGKTVASFSLCTNNNFKQGEDWKSIPEWHNIVCWGKQADIAAEQFRKGDCVYIEGRMAYRDWERDGIKHNIAEVTAVTCWKFTPAPIDERRTARNQASENSPPVPPEDEVPF
jgi:single-strand DNA-binding protein